MRSISGNQDSLEFSKFLEFIKNHSVKRYLEIGCRNGDTFYWVARSIGFRGTFAAIDLPEDDRSRDKLADTFRELQYDHGFKSAFVYLGNSHEAKTITWAREHGPYDLILIDADHRYSGVTRDFLCYHGMTRFVALHDIAAPDGHMSDGHFNGVGRFWREIKTKFKVMDQIINPGSQMGIGIVDAQSPISPAGLI